MKTSALIIIGNEILSGRTKDKNAGHIAECMTDHGIPLREVRVVPDIEETVVETVNDMRARYDIVFTTGGIGPTHDDITADCIAKAFGVKIEKNKEAYELLLQHYGAEEFNEARQRMTRIPVGAELIDNPVSVAPGFVLGNVYTMAGVPKIMQAMLESVLKTLETGVPILSVTVSCALPESKVAIALGEVQEQYPDIDLGSYPYFAPGNMGVSLVARGSDENKLEHVAQVLEQIVTEAGGVPKRL